MSKPITWKGKNLLNDLTSKQQNLKEMSSMQRYFKINQELVRGTSNLLVERILSIVVFKIDVLFVSLKKEILNKSVSEIRESFPLNLNLSGKGGRNGKSCKPGILQHLHKHST